MGTFLYQLVDSYTSPAGVTVINWYDKVYLSHSNFSTTLPTINKCVAPESIGVYKERLATGSLPVTTDEGPVFTYL